MKILSFLAERFAWQPYSRTLPTASDDESGGEVADAVVLFIHVEARDQGEERRRRVFKKALKHAKWLANKRDLSTIVLHSFTHLGGDNATPEFALAFLEELAERLTNTGYEVATTPFGWFSSWEIAVYGESLAKVWKEI